MATITNRGYVIPKSILDVHVLTSIRKDLTLQAEWDQERSYGPRPPKFRIFLENEDKVLLPSHYGLSRFGAAPKALDDVQKRNTLCFQGSLKSNLGQDEVAKAAMKAFDVRGGGILCMPPGGGKTAISLYLACQLKVKTLVVVHKQFLMDQWRERIEQFVPGASVGRLQGDTIDTDQDIVLAMLQSLSTRTYSREVMAGFGLLIVDEAHCICAPTFSQALLRINTPYKLAVSATPYRKDGLTTVIEHFMGPTFFAKPREKATNASVQIIWYTCPDYESPPPMTRFGKLCISSMITNLTRDTNRDAIILKHAKRATLAGRQTIILTDRRQHCETLVTALNEMKIEAGLYIGGMKQADLKASEKCSVIVGTYSQAKEGLDIPTLDTMIFATPKTDVVQATGRIMRYASNVAKSHPPLVIDIVDQWACLPAQFQKRKTFYKETGFDLQGVTSSQKTLQSCGFIQE